MKISKIVVLLLLLFTQLTYGQCDLDDFIADISANTPESVALKNAVLKDEELVDAWRRAFDIFPTNSKFITDIATLDKISKLASEGSAFRTKLGSNWSDALDDILRTANDLKCSSCGNAGRIGRSSIDQFLDDVDYFVSNFNVSSGGKGEVFYNWMRGTTKNGSVPTSNQLDELHQTIRDLSNRGVKEADVRGLGEAFDLGKPGAALKEYDLRLVNNVYTEYKNVNYASNALVNQSQTIDQFINGYLRNIESFDKFQWKAYFDKLKSAWGSEANALTQMKSQWKTVFESKSDDIFEVIWGNQNLKNSLFDSGLTKADAKLDFVDMVSSTDDALYKFIKVE
ncbi:hypothetical protein LVD15_11745 [Fulvivirga maritima]|uniref:hypothetical protein n=1 Tax=Fulvivirga maritima TaxID=2904247 RepID=UPI001F46C006|nr:hypothetical protein [Fulvivirga maritima]UII29068.1 hypothetical protein LVD15_11745 [Fulvivirga maritima]